LISEQRCLLRPAHNIHERDVVLQADPVEHLPERRRCRRVNQRIMTSLPHCFNHRECRQGIDQDGRSVPNRDSVGDQQEVPSWHHAVAGHHAASHHRDGLADQVLMALSRGDDDACALVSHRERLSYTRGERPHPFRRYLEDGSSVFAFSGNRPARKVGGSKQHADVSRMKGRGDHFDDDLVRSGIVPCGGLERKTQRSISPHFGANADG